MPEFRYVADEPRTYGLPGVGRVEEGDTRDLDADPGDGRWEPVSPAKPTAKPAAPAETPEEATK